MGLLATITRIVEGGGTLREARDASGLDAGQTARLTGITRDRILALDATPDAITAQEWDVLRVVYDVPGFVGRRPKGDAGAVIRCRWCFCTYTLASTSEYVPSGERHREQCTLLRALGERPR